jgi:uncharacterized membrane protein SpoIIM required for sporulation
MKLAKYNSISFITFLTGIAIGYFINIKFISDNFIDLAFNKDFNFHSLNFDVTVFRKIFLKNIIVAFLLSIGGYFSGGVLTVAVLFVNGFFLGSYFTSYHYCNISLLKFSYYFIFHGILEFYSFFLFSNIGYNGYEFYRKIIFKNETRINIKLIPFIKPTILLVIAALIECFLISNF